MGGSILVGGGRSEEHATKESFHIDSVLKER